MCALHPSHWSITGGDFCGEPHPVLYPRPGAASDLCPPPSAPALFSLKLANEDKEQKLTLLEEARVAMGKEAGELRAGLQEVERSRLEARRELQELRRQVPSAAAAFPGHRLCGP